MSHRYPGVILSLCMNLWLFVNQTASCTSSNVLTHFGKLWQQVMATVEKKEVIPSRKWGENRQNEVKYEADCRMEENGTIILTHPSIILR